MCPVTPLLVTSYTTPFYRRFGFSTQRNSSALELLAYLALGMIHSGISLYLHSYRRMMYLGILTLMLVLTACVFCDPQLDRQRKLSIYNERETPTFSSSEITCLLCIPLIRGQLTPPYMDHKLVSMCLLLQTSDSANPFWRFRLLVRQCQLHSPLRCVHKICNYEECNPRPNFVIDLVDPVENKGILNKNKSMQIYLFLISFV